MENMENMEGGYKWGKGQERRVRNHSQLHRVIKESRRLCPAAVPGDPLEMGAPNMGLDGPAIVGSSGRT
jgi:hypothetical protein